MQTKHLWYKVRGWYNLNRYALRMNEQSITAQKRLRALHFWAKHGLDATLDAFNVSRRTLFNWKAAYTRSNGNAAELENKSTAPITKRRRTNWDASVLAKARSIRSEFPRLGFEKLHCFLLDWCEARNLSRPSVSTLYRLAQSDKRLAAQRGKAPRAHRMKAQGVRKPKGFVPNAPGQCVGVDTIEIHGSGPYRGMRRYVATFTDVYSRFALAAAMPSKHAKHTAKLWHIARLCYPFKIERVLSDNGSEFKAAFTDSVTQSGAVRWLTYPKNPKMNAHAERFNRTIQEEFIEIYQDLLFEDIHAFNDKLLDYLVWFNEQRPHYALNLKSPMEYLKIYHQCNMYWKDTIVHHTAYIGL